MLKINQKKQLIFSGNKIKDYEKIITINGRNGYNVKCLCTV